MLLTGCAGTPTGESLGPESGSPPLPGDFARLPQTTLPGATADEVKLTAMGAALSKGWRIVKTGPGRLIAQREVDASLVASSGSGPLPGATLEVTSFFVQQGGSVDVATRAEVVSPAVAGQPARRMDVTETYRDALEQSLRSLSATWASNRARIARATPPAQGWPDPWAGTPYARPQGAEASPDTNPAPEVASPPAAEPAAVSADIAERPPEYPPEPESVATEPAWRAEPTGAAAPASPDVAETSLSAERERSDTPPYPEPRRRPTSPAPVVDATGALDTSYSYGSSGIADAAPRNDMMALPQGQSSSGRVTWAAYAEQYARQRGCQVSPAGSQLIESRQDGEVHKVPCEGSDSFLVKCQNGTCRGLL
ncbi:hypothetical protein [Thiorhodococcus minor]|uniref:Uncharacterized protein n=1 Tax=Thiorhodococcus minor TaxID=57489 RepID=A0A6M0K7Q6_9GAMM|nr:hypothetical protein [Thiorhodococcus minor]NEV64415.1 hypothetical protein [Thiorhodococcus minor]